MNASVITKLVSDEIEQLAYRVRRRILAVQRAYALIQRESWIVGEQDIEEVRNFNVSELHAVVSEIVNSHIR